MAARLENRAHDPAFAVMLGDSLAAMGLTQLSPVLDVGGGTAIAPRRLAQCGAFAGRIVGIGRSADPSEAAWLQAGAEGTFYVAIDFYACPRKQSAQVRQWP